MDADWIKSPAGRRIVLHWADPRPAWLWSGDGNSLLWRNPTARFFNAKRKQQGPKPAPDMVPIRGQIARLIRLGMTGRTSLSRIQFTAGGKPYSITCACTPLPLPDGQQALLIVGVDAVAAREPSETAEPFDRLSAALLPPGAEAVMVGADGEILGGRAQAFETMDRQQLAALLERDQASIVRDDTAWAVSRFRASPEGATLLLFEAEDQREAEIATEAPTLAQAPMEPTVETVTEDAAPSEPTTGRLTALFDRLAGEEHLFAPLEGEEPENPEATDTPAQSPTDDLAEAPDGTPPAAAPNLLVRLVGRGFEPLAKTPDPTLEPPVVQDKESVERVSRYNFDELARILNDRVSGDASPQSTPTTIEDIIADSDETPAPVSAEAGGPPAAATGALVNLGGETLVLNRLPLGILVFRDQQVLFANRAITEMTGYDSVESLRLAGLAAIFPGGDTAAQPAGPINHLVQQNGTLVPVTARLQSVSWQARPALMLSASATEVRTGHEAAVRAFAESLAETRADGFVEASRSGVISLVSAHALQVLDRPEQQVLGRPLTDIVHRDDAAALRAFFERPARFAETARPSILLRGDKPNTELLLYAQGQAGIITGYMGFLRRLDAAPRLALPPAEGTGSPMLLGRISRGIRRPLNTVIGFSDLIRSAAFGPVENLRYREYAQDISTAGHEIATLVDELDDFARLQDGRYRPVRGTVDLAALLHACVTRVRSQAGAARVLVRSAISERLPCITADGASLSQAVLNLLASAIDQSPPGGSVVLSAQLEEDGRILVHVRDSASSSIDLSDRFVVFRDGTGRDGAPLAPVRSSIGLVLTRALLAVNGCTLSVGPAGGIGTLFTLGIAAELVAKPALPAPMATLE